jgi:phosphoglycolate phosphatase-like HAD superfamily hydrolase
MIGDTDGDVVAGARAGTRTILLEYPPSAHKRVGGSAPDAVADSLQKAATIALAAR